MPVSLVRRPAVAGRFYPAQRDVLLHDIKSYLAAPAAKVRAFGCVVPHAGYMYSGHVAGAVYARLDLPSRFIILCPNHTGMGKPIAVMSRGSWDTPLGQAEVDEPLASALLASCHLASEDADAHRAEHALEVQLPFLQAIRAKFTFVPITVGVGSFEPLHALGEAMARIISEAKEPVLIIASSDMNHYEPDAITRVKDHKAIDKILALDARGLFDVIMQEDISMCGYGPTVAMLTAAKGLGASSAELVKYATSGDISGDRNMVVGYAGVIVS
ncbi:MAG TPA: AmmeMemoRadiSam system protein B [Terriglobales bacterium]|nr:AmmeMemoRadiSam system protein B [Terriglobales bacterium]